MTHAPAVHIVGKGIVGRRLHRMLGERPVIVHDPYWSDVTGVTPRDVVVLAHGGEHAPAAHDLLRRGLHVVTIGDSVDDARRLLDNEAAAVESGTTLVVGAAMTPGLSGLIARHLAGQLERVDEIHVAVHGTARSRLRTLAPSVAERDVHGLARR